jgi:hypothetical protein
VREFIGHHRRAVRGATSARATFALVAGITVALSAPAAAGQNMHGDVNKTVVGTAPAGTTFTVHYSCTSGPTGDLQFDVNGNPTPPSSNFFNSLGGGAAATCTISETVTGGASAVSYQCASGGPNATCDPSGASATFNGGTSTNVTFTVTNTFAAAAVPTPVPAAARLTG